MFLSNFILSRVEKSFYCHMVGLAKKTDIQQKFIKNEGMEIYKSVEIRSTISYRIETMTRIENAVLQIYKLVQKIDILFYNYK